MAITPIEDQNQCFNIIELFKRNFSSDRGFSGVTHALTGVVAVELFAIAGLYFDFLDKWVAFPMLAVIIAFTLTVIGSTLINDLDNTRSTSMSALGPVGVVLSFFFRGSSRLIQTLVRTSKDDPTPNPHRGFWHTLISSFLLGGLVILVTSISLMVKIPLLGEIKLGEVFALLILAVTIHLFLAALAKPFVSKIKKGFILGDLLAFLVSLAASFSLFIFIPTDNYIWLGVGVCLGTMTHIVGDTFTKQGTPMFFPLTVFTKGRFWWYTRFASIESGGDFEVHAISKILIVAMIVLIVPIVILL